MKVFTRDYRVSGDFPPPIIRYFADMRYAVLDIETSGLSAANSKAVLIGLLTRTDSGIRVTQFLAENHYEENKVLDATVDFLRRESIDYLITYNGLSFDLPFINRRLAESFSEDHIRLYNFDLYRFLRNNSDLKKRIGSLSQTSVENYYGIFSDRNDTITGRESISLFNEYSLSGNSTVEKIILTHNREDVLQLHRLMYLVPEDIENMDDAMAGYGFPIRNGEYSVRPSLKNKGSGRSVDYVLKINGDQNGDPVSAAYFPDIDSPVSARFNADTFMYEIELPVSCAEVPGDTPYLDVLSLGLELDDDPDCINGYLILNPRTINLVAAKIANMIIEKNRPE